MDDLYTQLIGGAPPQAQIPAIVEQLRRRRSLGELGALSGDRVLSPFGQDMVRQTDDYAEQLQNIRQKDTDNAQTKAYQDAQLGHMQRVLDATIARDAQNREHQRRADEAALLRSQAAMERAKKAGTPAPKALPISAGKDLQETRLQLDKIVGLKNTFKDAYARTSIPGGRTLSNTLSKLGVGTDAMDEAQNWWRQFDFDFTLPMRNKTFGATLSTNEQKAWSDAAAGKEMKADQIKDILNSMERWQKTNLEQKAAMYRSGYNPAMVDAAAGVEHQEEPPQSGAPPEALAELEAAIRAGDDAAIQEFTEVFGEENLPAYLRPAQ